MSRSPSRDRAKARSGRTLAGTSGGGGGGGTPTDPSGMTGKVLWYRGKDLTTGSVTTLTDQSGAGNNLTGTNASVGTTNATATGKYLDATDATFTPTKAPDLCLAGIAADSTLAATLTSGYANDGTVSGTFYWHSGATFPHWLERTYITAATYTAYTLTPNSGTASKNPSAWTLAGSNDHSSWTTLDTRSSISWSGSTPQTFTFSNSTAYRYYRCTFTASVDGTYATISEFSMGSDVNAIAAAERWVVIKANINFHSWFYGNSGSNNAYPDTGNILEDFGMNTQQTITPGVSLTSWRLYRTAIDATAFTAWIDNVQVKNVATPSRMWPNQFKPLERLYARVAEDLVFNRRLTSDEATALIAYFNTEHGLTVT